MPITQKWKEIQMWKEVWQKLQDIRNILSDIETTSPNDERSNKALDWNVELGQLQRIIREFWKS